MNEPEGSGMIRVDLVFEKLQALMQAVRPISRPSPTTSS